MYCCSFCHQLLGRSMLSCKSQQSQRAHQQLFALLFMPTINPGASAISHHFSLETRSRRDHGLLSPVSVCPNARDQQKCGSRRFVSWHFSLPSHFYHNKFYHVPWQLSYTGWTSPPCPQYRRLVATGVNWGRIWRKSLNKQYTNLSWHCCACTWIDVFISSYIFYIFCLGSAGLCRKPCLGQKAKHTVRTSTQSCISVMPNLTKKTIIFRGKLSKGTASS